ncbi:MAG: SRPBCC family protein, partial [Rhodococcus sp.]|nr:SRPBCC family protein [Rhodococcus sp. (in: high G+C Gram-positive bacteria)]
ATGIGGFFERTFAPKGLQRIQAQVLDNLKRELV